MEEVKTLKAPSPAWIHPLELKDTKIELFRELIKEFYEKAQRAVKVTEAKPGSKPLVKVVAIGEKVGPSFEIPVPERMEGFGKLTFDIEKCWGCAACKVQCLTGALNVAETENKRAIRLDYWKCIACKECINSCPKEAINFKKVFDLQAFLSEPSVCVEIDISRCSRCGGVIAPVPELTEVEQKSRELNVPLRYRANVTSLCGQCRRELMATSLLRSRGIRR